MANTTFLHALTKNFLGDAPNWYKLTIISFLIINPIIFTINPFIAGWLLVAQFIFTLTMALKCYPLQPGGLLAIEAIFIGMTTTVQVHHEILVNLEVLLLLIFMVAGIYFMKQLLLFVFTKILLSIRSKILLSLAFCLSAAFLSAFLDALTVIAVIISVVIGFYNIYYEVASANTNKQDQTSFAAELEQYRAFLRSLLMHSAVGTAFGGVMTMVGEPQNLIIAEHAHWHFNEFLIRMSPVTVPAFICGIITCILVEKFKIFGYGAALSPRIREILVDFDQTQTAKRTNTDKAKLIVQLIIAIWLIVALSLHLAAVGLIGLSVIVLVTSFTGIIQEHNIGKAFEESLPFTALLVVFFSIVAVIVDQQLFKPIIDFVLHIEDASMQKVVFYIANGLLSMISDNVFVGTVYITELQTALDNAIIAKDQFDILAVAINTGTNLPSVATPNGQAAFLFLLTSAIAPLIHLSYQRMFFMALPYTIVLTFVGLAAVLFLLEPITQYFHNIGLII